MSAQHKYGRISETAASYMRSRGWPIHIHTHRRNDMHKVAKWIRMFKYYHDLQKVHEGKFVIIIF